MAGIKRSDSNYVRSAYRRSGSGRPDYGQSKNRGQIWSIIIVLLLIVVLAGGAVWMYLSRTGGEEAVVSEEIETVSPEVAAPRPTEPVPEAEPSQPSVEEEVAAAAPSEEEDEFASILEELGGTEEPPEEEAPSPEMAEPQTPAAEGETAMGAAPEESPLSPEDEAQLSAEELAVLEKEAEKAVEEKAEQLTEELSEAEQLLEETREAKESFKDIQESQEEELAAITPPSRKAPPKRTAQEGFPKTVTIQSGDSLSLIAKRVYGDVNKWRLIYEANQDRLENPNQLLVGMELTVPAPK